MSFSVCTDVLGWQPYPGIDGFSSLLTATCALSVCFLIAKLQKAHESHPNLHGKFVLFAALILAIVAVLKVFSDPSGENAKGGNIGFDVAYLATLMGQWWVQLAVVVFAFFHEVEGPRVVRRTLVITTGAAVALGIVPFLSLVVGCKTCGVVVVEVILTIGFAVIVFSPQLLSKSSQPRPAARLPWSLFQLIAHSLFLLENVLLVVSSKAEATKCMILISDIVYYLLYAPMLWFTLRKDAWYWREEGALAAATPLLSPAQRKLFAATSSINDAEDDNINDFDGGSVVSSVSASKDRRGGNLVRIPYHNLKLNRLVGSGTFADVFKGSYRGTTVAIKRLKIPAHASSDMVDKVIQNLLNESQLLSRLRHPNVLGLVGVIAEGRDLGLVTDYCDKGALFDVIHAATQAYGAGEHASIVSTADAGSQFGSRSSSAATGDNAQVKYSAELRATWELRLKIAVETCRGVAYLHGLNPVVIHRDLKSHNILLCADWTAKVGDLGLSRTKETFSKETMTSLGTPQWMAPEVMLGERYDTSCDAFALGVILFELVTMDAPWNQLKNPVQVITRVSVQGKRLAIPSYAPPGVSDLVNRCFAGPEERPTLAQMADELESVIDTVVAMNLAPPSDQFVTHY